MTSNPWLKTGADPELEEQAREKIALIRQLEGEVPLVIIVHDLATQSVIYMSQRGRDLLGVTLEEIQLAHTEYHARYFNPEDAEVYTPKIIGLVENNTEELISFFQQVRTAPGRQWAWYLSATKIFLRDREGKPRLLITVSLAVDTLHPIAAKMEKLLEENNFLRSHSSLFATLTKREKEILKRMALGQSSTEIAAALFISETTASTHRRNIRKKIGAQTPYDITRFAQAFDLI